MDVSVFMQA
uniref:Uncharacterized protein n=1 Tax=Oryza glumipatula TaxID=40148 RepID=A0A0G2KBN0_9ORYZ